MSVLVRSSLGLVGSCVIVSVVLAVLSGLESTARAEPKLGAATAPELLLKLGTAVDSGDGAAILACFDTSKPGGRVFPDYLVSTTGLNRGRVAVLHKADTYGAAVRAKAEPLLWRLWDPTGDYAKLLAENTSAKEGSLIHPPGLKYAMVIVKKHGVFFFDASSVFQDVAAEWFEQEKAKFVKVGGEWTHAASSATSAEDLLAKLAKLADE
jgi:hypothetical protein